MRVCARCATFSSRRRPASDGLCALRPRGNLHAAGLLPAARHRRERCRDPRSRREPEGAAARPSHRATSTRSPDFADKAGLADALLASARPIAYSVPQLMDFLDRAGLTFGRWVRQAPYLPWCGALAPCLITPSWSSSRRKRNMPPSSLFRGTMVRHSAVAYRKDRPRRVTARRFRRRCLARLHAHSAARYARRAGAAAPGAAAVLINRNHTYTDLYLPIDARQERLLAASMGNARSPRLPRGERRNRARAFFQRLWLWDQVVFDTSLRPRKAG